MLKNKKDFLINYIEWITGILVLAVYLITLAPSVIQIDSGELTAVQSILGIAHPTGYPLFTILGFIFLQIPLPLTTAVQANLLSAIWCSLGIVFFIKSSMLISNHFVINTGQTGTKKKLKKKLEPEDSDNSFGNRSALLSSVFGSIVLAFSQTYWLQSTSVEVYSLQIFLFTLMLYFIFKSFFNESGSANQWYYVAVILALGFANHMTTLLILPGLAFLFFIKNGFRGKTFRKLGIMILIFLPVLVLVYLYLPLRASSGPEINWGNPANFENFWRHFTGKQYMVWLFESVESAKIQLINFLRNFPGEFTIAGLIFFAAGLYGLYRHNKIIFIFILLLFVSTVLYSVNYNISDIDSYFILAYLSAGFFIVFGMRFFIELTKPILIRQKYFLIIFLLIALLPLYLNFSKADQSGAYTFRDYTLEILNHAEPNALLFTYQWDFFVSPSYYFQFSENYRKDVAVIDKELLRRSWYYDQVQTNYADVFADMKSEVKQFLDAVSPFEKNEVFNSSLIEMHYRSIMTKLISDNFAKRNIYIGIELFQNEMSRGEFSLPAGYSIIPHLFMFKVVKGNDYVPAPDPEYRIRFPEIKNRYVETIEKFAAQMLIYRTLYELQFNKTDRAELYARKLKAEFPGIAVPQQIQHLIE